MNQEGISMRRPSLRLAAGTLAVFSLAALSLFSLQSGDREAVAQQPGATRRGNEMKQMEMKGAQTPGAAAQPAAAVTKAVSVVHPLGDSKVKGKVTFAKQADGVLVTAEISGLTPGDHGFHVHEWGDASSADGMSAGGHFNPHGHQHGRPDATERHAGDFGNLTADAQGNAKYSRVDKAMTLEGPTSVIGRSIIIHANADDFSQPTGNAGGRVAVGVIGIANPAN
jgi:superoxide dismutase, Cu-Zn family